MSSPNEENVTAATGEDFDREFKEKGFLSSLLAESIKSIRDECGDWFNLAEDACNSLQRIAIRGAETIKESTLDPKTLATFVVLRSSSTAQGTVILAERGMVVEARTLVRGMIENALCVGALVDNPVTFIEMFQKDDAASKKAQANFILAKNMVKDSTPDHAALTELLAKIEKGVQNLSIKALAELSPLTTLYLAYRVLSNDSAHPSATSLKRHMRLHPDGGAWIGYLLGPAEPNELKATLHLFLQAAISIGVGYTQLVDDKQGNAEIDGLSSRLVALLERDRP